MGWMFDNIHTVFRCTLFYQLVPMCRLRGWSGDLQMPQRTRRKVSSLSATHVFKCTICHKHASITKTRFCCVCAVNAEKDQSSSSSSLSWNEWEWKCKNMTTTRKPLWCHVIVREMYQTCLSGCLEAQDSAGGNSILFAAKMSEIHRHI